MRGIIWFTVLFVLLSTMIIGQQFHTELVVNNTLNESFSIYELSNNKLGRPANLTFESEVNLSEVNDSSYHLHNIILSFSDFFTTTMFELTQWGFEFGFNNPQYDFVFMSKVLVVIIYLVLAPLVLFPSIVISGFVYVGVKALIKFVKERKRKGKENKE